jgi:peroxiredoxin
VLVPHHHRKAGRPDPQERQPLSSLSVVSVPRPRLLAWSLVAAVVVIVIGTVVWAQSSGDDGVDATLDDASAVVTYPNDGLGNQEVEGDLFPNATFLDRNDNEVSSAELLGNPLVVNLWFSTCAPCAKELPDFAEVHAEVGEEVRFVGVNTIDSVEVMERFAGERGVQYELLRDQYAELANGIGAVAFPITLFVTSEGVIVEQTGVLDADELRERVADLIAVDQGA